LGVSTIWAYLQSGRLYILAIFDITFPIDDHVETPKLGVSTLVKD
jgi:hypothetical protein